MPNGTCKVCASPTAAQRLYCSERCKGRGRPKWPCVDCGNPTGVNKSAPQGKSKRCRKCAKAWRRATAEHGLPNTFKYHGCRCDPCRLAWNAYCSEHQRGQRAAGVYPSGREPKRLTCDECGKALQSRAGRAADGRVLCKPHRDKANGNVRGGWIDPVRRRALYEQADWNCQICGESMSRAWSLDDPWSPTLDHIIPRSRGGSDDPSNLRPAHMWCNGSLNDGRAYSDDDFRRPVAV